MKSFRTFVAEDQKRTSYKGVFNKSNFDIENLRQYSDQITAYYKGKNAIYRGMKNIGDVAVADGNKIKRQSAYAQNNLYTMLMSEILPSWREYPKRSNSFICTNSTKYSNYYGTDRYHIIPLENQKIAVCSDSDIWGAFPNIQREIPPMSQRSMNTFNGLINLLASWLLPNIKSVDDIDDAFTSRSKTITLFNAMTRNIHKLLKGKQEYLDDMIVDISRNWVGDIPLDDWLEEDFFPWFKENPKLTMIDYLDNILNPIKNDFQLMTPDRYYSTSFLSDTDGLEVWLSGLVLCVHITAYGKLIKGLGLK